VLSTRVSPPGALISRGPSPGSRLLRLRPQHLERGAVILLERRVSRIGAKGAPGSTAVFSTSPSSGSRISSAASTACQPTEKSQLAHRWLHSRRLSIDQPVNDALRSICFFV
jgi:hypothetical protein